MSITVLLICFLLFVFCQAIADSIAFKKIRSGEIKENKRIRMYKSTIVWSWIPCIIILTLTFTSSLSLDNIGVKFVNFNLKLMNIWLLIGTFIIIGAITLLSIYQIFAYKISASYRKQLETLKLDPLYLVVQPKTKKEKKWWTLISLTAGITEEILYRGFLIYLISNQFQNIPLYLAMIIASLIFGIAHSYQGIVGLFKTSAIGFLLAVIYVSMGSIILGMIIHFIMDISFKYLSVDKIEEDN